MREKGWCSVQIRYLFNQGLYSVREHSMSGQGNNVVGVQSGNIVDSQSGNIPCLVKETMWLVFNQGIVDIQSGNIPCLVKETM